MTYGGVAKEAGLPGRARQVGYALHAISEGMQEIPWQRVVNARGRISLPDWEGQGSLQRSLLEAEGVVFDEAGRIDLAHYGWLLD
jgi:methylated-DNA-protein-cysteine methyltransferase-like protein